MVAPGAARIVTHGIWNGPVFVFRAISSTSGITGGREAVSIADATLAHIIGLLGCFWRWQVEAEECLEICLDRPALVPARFSFDTSRKY